ncbi:MAG: low molecular weight phosphotyrosine protein phosphatase [Flammeovirgaceae bacterium]|nr:MAG: low molecular weight phosphotyrosine protein phosphatase [Flammeovirgaceae bacterium]
MKNVKVLFVCLGNICRSPLAEALFKHKLKQLGLQDTIEADSCGTSNYHIGELPDSRTMANARKNGIVIEHRGRQLSKDDLNFFDYILAMDESNYENILYLGRNQTILHKVSLMRSYDPVGNCRDVPDPYYGGERGFQEVFEILDRSLDGFLQFLIQKEGITVSPKPAG